MKTIHALIVTTALISVIPTSYAEILSSELKSGWPSAVICKDTNDQREWVFNLTTPKNSNGETVYSAFYAINGYAGRASYKFNSDKSFSQLSNGGSWDCAINQWSISDLEANKRAYYQFYYQPAQP
ncbi:MAG: hypothetical protein OQL19_20780 [Gammaproteobacteria bacterium]|nr:hypothetical protein [Gammaproteobacteria bacterium]